MDPDPPSPPAFEKVPPWDELLTVPYVARRLAVHPSTVRSWIEAGTIQSLKLPGGRYRIPRTELVRILRSK